MQRSYKRLSTSSENDTTSAGNDLHSTHSSTPTSTTSITGTSTGNNAGILHPSTTENSLGSDASYTDQSAAAGSGTVSGGIANKNSKGVSPVSVTSSSGGTAAATRPASPTSVSKSMGERFIEKIYAALWVALALIIARHVDLPKTILSDPEIIRPVFNTATVLYSINFVLLLYLGVYLPKVVGLKDSSAWEVYCPRVIPIITFNGILGTLLFLRSLWPVWGFLTPFIVGIEGFGLFFAMHFVPWF